MQGNATEASIFGNANATFSNTNTSDTIDTVNSSDNIDSNAANFTDTDTTNDTQNSNEIRQDFEEQSHIGTNSSSPVSASATEFISPPFMPRSTTVSPGFINNNNNSVLNYTHTADVDGSLSTPAEESVTANNTSIDQTPPAIITADNGRADISPLTADEGNDQVSRNTSDQQNTTSIIDIPMQNQQLSIPIEGVGMLEYPFVQHENQSSLNAPSPEQNVVNNDFDIQKSANAASNTGTSQIEEFPAGSTTSTTSTTAIPSYTDPKPLQMPSSDSSTISRNPSEPVPPETVIISAIDSITGMTIQNGEMATSNSSVTFTFEGFGDSGVSGYFCSIENLEPFYCSSPVIYDPNIIQEVGFGGSISSNPLGHSFQVSAIDSSGNMDPTPAVFNWMATDSIEAEFIAPETITTESLTPNTIALHLRYQ